MGLSAPSPRWLISVTSRPGCFVLRSPLSGSADETEHLEERCAESEDMTLESIFAPKPGECINVTSDLNIYQVKLTHDPPMTHPMTRPTTRPMTHPMARA